MSKIFLLVILLFSTDIAFASSDTVSVEKFIESSVISYELRKNLKEIYDTIINNKIGKLLITKINECFRTEEGKNLCLQFIKGYETRFEPNNGNKLLIVINPSDLKSEVLLIEGVGKQVFKLKETGSEVRLVETIRDSKPDEIIVHELIHLKHFLEERLGYATESHERKIPPIPRNMENFKRMKYSSACGMGIVYMHPEEKKLFPELEPKEVIAPKPKSMVPLTDTWARRTPWDSFEERRTVCGPDLDGITENAYRKAKDRPPRFIYQG